MAIELPIECKLMTENDLEISYRIYADSRKEEMNLAPGWSDDQKDLFLRQQFKAQLDSYRQEFANAKFYMIWNGESPAGRFFIDNRDDEIRIIDITLFDVFRGQGIGRRLIQSVLDDAQKTNKHVRLHVIQNNQAIRLYDRLGFQPVDTTGIYWLMEWNPPNGCKQSPITARRQTT
jgi:ribosomal protein S18 acetylase RimI-like enzyme